MNSLCLTKRLMPLMSFVLCFVGCAQTHLSEISYVDEVQADSTHTKNHATQIAFPNVDSPSMAEAMVTASPRTISDRHNDDVVEIDLSHAVQTSLENNKIIRSAGTFGTRGNPILANPLNTSSFYDSAILESGVLFGGRGMESALAAFDATWSTNIAWSSNTQLLNTPTATTPNSLKTEGANFNTELSKVFGNGGQIIVGHNWNYSGTDNPSSRLFQSAYTGQASLEYRHPLLAGSGREFTSIAGPVSQNFNGLTGVTQGVLIARINGDISIADFEISVRDMLFDVEQTYWDLYLAYRRYDTAVVAVRSAHQTWKESKIKLDIGTLKASDEAQARDRYYETKAQAESSLATVFDTELRFRRLLGMKVNDGTVLRPAEEPISAEIVVDWQAALAEALTRRVELRKQKWNIKSLRLQLKAAKSLVKPRLDLTAGYRLNAFGDRLLGNDDIPAGNAFETLVDGQQPGWDIGLLMNVPVGFRSAKTQVRNIELRTAKAMDVLAAQELEITHELGNSIQNLSQFHSVAKSNANRLEAARVRVSKLRLELQEGTITPDPLVRAQASLATAEVAYYESLTNYNKRLAEFHYRKGTLLSNYNIYLSEGPWSEAALCDAARRAHERANAVPNEHLHQEPEQFAFPDFRPGQPAVSLANHEEMSAPIEVDEAPALPPVTPPDIDDEDPENTDGPSMDPGTEPEDASAAEDFELDAEKTPPPVDELDADPITPDEVTADDVFGVTEPAAVETEQPTFELREQDSFSLFEVQTSPELPIFELKELPSNNGTPLENVRQNLRAIADLEQSIFDPEVAPASGTVDPRRGSDRPVVITDWIDLKPVPKRKSSPKPMLPNNTPGQPQKRAAPKPRTPIVTANKPVQTNTKPAKNSGDKSPSEPENDEFNSWEPSEDPFWINEGEPVRRDSRFEDYESSFQPIKS